MTIKDAAHDCWETAQRIDEKFHTWLNYCAALHGACEDEKQSNEDKLQTNKRNQIIEESLKKSAKTAVDQADAAQKQMGKSLDEATRSFKKASDSYPSG